MEGRGVPLTRYAGLTDLVGCCEQTDLGSTITHYYEFIDCRNTNSTASSRHLEPNSWGRGYIVVESTRSDLQA